MPRPTRPGDLEMTADPTAALVVNGTLELLQNSAVAGAFVGLTAASTVRLSGCTVTGPTAFANVTVLGPRAGVTTTLIAPQLPGPSADGRTYPVLSVSDWSGTILVGGTGVVRGSFTVTVGSTAVLGMTSPTRNATVYGDVLVPDDSAVALSAAQTNSLRVSTVNAGSGAARGVVSGSAWVTQRLTLASGIVVSAGFSSGVSQFSPWAGGLNRVVLDGCRLLSGALAGLAGTALEVATGPAATTMDTPNSLSSPWGLYSSARGASAAAPRRRPSGRRSARGNTFPGRPTSRGGRRSGRGGSDPSSWPATQRM